MLGQKLYILQDSLEFMQTSFFLLLYFLTATHMCADSSSCGLSRGHDKTRRQSVQPDPRVCIRPAP